MIPFLPFFNDSTSTFATFFLHVATIAEKENAKPLFIKWKWQTKYVPYLHNLEPFLCGVIIDVNLKHFFGVTCTKMHFSQMIDFQKGSDRKSDDRNSKRIYFKYTAGTTQREDCSNGFLFLDSMFKNVRVHRKWCNSQLPYSWGQCQIDWKSIAFIDVLIKSPLILFHFENFRF